MNAAPKIGARFLHSRVIDANKQPALYVVTRVAKGTVWYKQPDESKAHLFCSVEEFPRYAKAMVA